MMLKDFEDNGWVLVDETNDYYILKYNGQGINTVISKETGTANESF